jgi:hypothetical protein
MYVLAEFKPDSWSMSGHWQLVPGVYSDWDSAKGACSEHEEASEREVAIVPVADLSIWGITEEEYHWLND